MLKYILIKMTDGVLYGTGFLLFYGGVGGVLFLLITDLSVFQITSKISEVSGLEEKAIQQPDAIKTRVVKKFLAPSSKIPSNYKVIRVNETGTSFVAAVKDAHENGGNTAIILAPGTYDIDRTVYIRQPGIFITSETGSPYDVRIKGRGVFASGREGVLIRVSANNFTIDGITLSDSPNHLIQIAAEDNASYATVNNMILEDAYEQFLKVSYNRKSKADNFSYEGKVTNSVFQYTQGLAYNFYTGGIDALGAKGWIVENNVFRDIASPSKHIAQHAVHFWVNSENNIIRNNLFIDNDRAIGFGMPLKNHSQTVEFSSRGGVIENNVIFHAKNGDPFGDVGIVLEASEGTVIKDNTIYVEHDYPRAIEYRFKESKLVKIRGNKTNKTITSRNGGTAELSNNSETLSKEEFIVKYNQIMNNLGIDEIKAPIIEEEEK
ncbi:right-handed parallel beta-helix repeat-containing protein [Alteromonas sp. K632G]|jgi:hypothetical protein|uniref:right-handed parallel beta-helix repeat-containing protein n=1 Tax=Alteromonas sp. K632G TaxID=2820757 RepID=UPI000C0D8F55|nr:right-handed parallel beta-helix repeat-containing protein [Alteromonas sp. K632G]MBO7922672.1 right-handed parallel beta-helix repeat-containing protein [Alteromonas sp. K632G]PHS59379.1 MAG: hypothetical protein COB03_02840 [Alteromonas sp.]